MAQSLKLKRFTNVAVLKRIEFSLLLEFIESDDRIKTFLVERGLVWTTDPRQFDYNQLARILMSPSVETPDELLDALYFVDGLADPEYYDRILEEAHKAGINLGAEDPSPEDLALRAWLADRNILERVHADQHRVRPKKFQSYFARRDSYFDFDHPSDIVLSKLEDDLDEWFDFKKKGRGTKVFPFFKSDGAWFLVRHGQRIKREGTLEADGESGSIFYRPEKFDVLIYYPDKGELAIHADTKGEREAYCRCLGTHLFGDADFFRFDDAVAKYTLQPLIELGRDALACSDVEGIKHIRLYELHIKHKSGQKDIEARKADDVFQALADQQRVLKGEQGSITLVRAKFKVTFDGGKERAVTIEPPNVASFDRESDNAVIHEWLGRCGFIYTHDNEEAGHDEPDPVLEAA